MSGFTEPRAYGASERPGKKDVVFAWGTCSAMLPLVSRISKDLIECHERLSQLRPEMTKLDRQRRNLEWPDRARRYHLQEELTALDGKLLQLESELYQLGLSVLHGPVGLVGFPTIVNDRRAFFSWEPGEESIAFWNYAGDSTRRPVPEAWTKQTEVRSERPRRKGRSDRR